MLPGQVLQGLEVVVVPGGGQPGGPEGLGRSQGQPEGHSLGQGGCGQAGVGRLKPGPRNFFQFCQDQFRMVGGGRQVDGAGHLQPAAYRAGHLDPEQAGNASPPGRQGFGQGQEVPQAEEPGVALQAGQAGLNLLLRFGPEAGKPGQAVLPAGVLQFTQAGDVQFVNQHPGLFGAQSRHPEQFQKPRRGLVPELLVEGRFPRASRSSITPARELPMPLTWASSPERRATSRSPGKVSTARAPASKALTLKGFSPASSKRRAISSRTAATSFLSIRIACQRSGFSSQIVSCFGSSFNKSGS